MLFHCTQGCVSTRTQNESSLVVGAMTRPQTLWSPAVVTMKGKVAWPAGGDGAAAVVAGGHLPGPAVGGGAVGDRVCSGEVSVPFSASR